MLLQHVWKPRRCGQISAITVNSLLHCTVRENIFSITVFSNTVQYSRVQYIFRAQQELLITSPQKTCRRCGFCQYCIYCRPGISGNSLLHVMYSTVYCVQHTLLEWQSRHTVQYYHSEWIPLQMQYSRSMKDIHQDTASKSEQPFALVQNPRASHPVRCHLCSLPLPIPWITVQ